MPKDPRSWGLTSLFAFVLLASSCATEIPPSNPPPTTTTSAVTTTTATPTRQAVPTTLSPTMTAPPCSIDDEARDLIREWNRISTALLASYMHGSVTSEQFVTKSDHLIPKLDRVVQDLRYLRQCLSAAEMAIFEPFLGTYSNKLSAYSALADAVRLASQEMETAAIEILMTAKAESAILVCEVTRITGERLPGADDC